MQGPSAAILINEVDIYPAIAGQDVDGGYKVTYAANPTYDSVACMVEADDMYEVLEQERIVQYLVWYIMTDKRYNLLARSKIIYVDDGGETHTMITEASRGEAERGGVYTIRASERI